MSHDITISISDEVYESLIGLKLRYYKDDDIDVVARKMFDLGLVTAEKADGLSMLDMLSAVVWDRFVELDQTRKDSPGRRVGNLVARLNTSLENIVTVLVDLDEVISKFIPEEVAVKRAVTQPLAMAGLGQAIVDSRRYPSPGRLDLSGWDPGKKAPKPSKRLRSLDFLKITKPKEPETTDPQEPTTTKNEDMDLEYQ